MAEPLNPRRWIEFTLDTYPATTDTTYRWSMRSLAGTFFVEGRIPAASPEEITRRASDMSGAYHIDSARIIVNDDDGLILGLLAGVTTRWFKNREAAFKLLSDTAFAAGAAPRILFAGHCYDVQAGGDNIASFEFEEPLARYLDRLYPQYTLGDAYPFAFEERGPTVASGLSLSAAVLAQPHAAPTLAAVATSGGSSDFNGTQHYAIATVHAGILSELSNIVSVAITAGQKVELTWSGLAVGADEVRVFRGDDVNFTQFNRYRVSGATYSISDVDAGESGVDDLFPGYNTRSTTPGGADPHWDLVYRETKLYTIAVRYSDGSESLCSVPIEVGLYPRNAPLTIRVSLSGTPTPVDGLTVDGVKLRRSGQFYHFGWIPDREWDMVVGDFPFDDDLSDTTASSSCVQDGPRFNIPLALRKQVIPIYYGPFIDTAVDPITGAASKGMLPTFHMGFTHLEAGSGTIPEPSAEIAALLGADVNGWGELVICLGEMDIPSVYASNLAETPVRTLLGAERFGVDILVPGQSGWPLDTNTVSRNGFDVTVIYARGPILWHHILGLVNITVDGCGWKSTDGEAIDQAGPGLQSFISEHVLAHDGAGYTSGPQVGLPLYFGGRSMIWTSMVAAWQALTALRLGTTKGYLISMPLLRPTSLREILATWHVTFDAFTANNSSVQFYPFSIDDLASATSGTAIREFLEINGPLPKPRIAWDEIENEIHFTVGWDPEQDTPRTPVLKVRNPNAIDALRDVSRQPIAADDIPVRSLAYTADDATANDAMGRRLLRLSQAPVYQAVPLKTAAIDLEIGAQVRLKHRKGIGLDLAPHVILGHIMVGDDIIIETMNITDILGTAIGASVESGGGGWGWELWP